MVWNALRIKKLLLNFNIKLNFFAENTLFYVCDRLLKLWVCERYETVTLPLSPPSFYLPIFISVPPCCIKRKINKIRRPSKSTLPPKFTILTTHLPYLQKIWPHKSLTHLWRNKKIPWSNSGCFWEARPLGNKSGKSNLKKKNRLHHIKCGLLQKNTSYILLTQTFLFKIHSAKPCNLSALSKEPNRVYTETDNLILNSMLPPSCPLWENKYKQHHIRMIRNLLVRFRATDATLDHTDVILERCRAPTKSCFYHWSRSVTLRGCDGR